MTDVIPVRIRTARVQHQCGDYLCRVPIEPGERYEDHRLPPGRDDCIGNTRWLKHKIHAPRLPDAGPAGCEIAAAYREHAARQAARR